MKKSNLNLTISTIELLKLHQAIRIAQKRESTVFHSKTLELISSAMNNLPESFYDEPVNFIVFRLRDNNLNGFIKDLVKVGYVTRNGNIENIRN